MMSHFCVWIDHYQAKIFNVTDDVDVNAIDDQKPRHHIHRTSDHVGLGTEPMSAAFLNEVATALQPAKAIFIVGPGRAKTDLAGCLNEHFPAIAKQIWAIEPMDHPSDAELIDTARKYFRAAIRMHR
ncbi:MAG TPA: translational machinery protein [Devosia sp.]|nr:translational machinery protein [Devosia sp.]